MPQTADVLFDRGLTIVTSMVERVDPDDWDRPSACAGWTARDVLGHLGSAIHMGAGFLRGEQPAWPEVERPGELVGDDPAAYWAPIAEEARAALVGAELDREVDTPMGRRTIADRLAFPAIDLYLHAWDIGHPLGLDTELPDELIEFAHAHLDPIPDDMMRREGVFGPELEAPAGASAAEAFLAWTGRPVG